MRRLLLVMMCASGYLLTASGSAAQTGDAWIGTWTLNIAQSSFDPANLAPKSQTTKMTAARGRVSAITDGVDADGKKTHTEPTYTFDGKDYDYKGAADPNRTRVCTRAAGRHSSYATKVNGAITRNAGGALPPHGNART